MLKVFLRATAMVIIVLATVLASPTIAKQNEHSEASSETASNLATQKDKPGSIKTTIKAQKDKRALRLAKFFRAKKSPFTPYAADFVKIADKYDLDWRLLPAISYLESQAGLLVPTGSYNPYGWNNGNFRFKSWVAATNYVAREIVARWSYLGEIDPWKIGKFYAASPTWSSRVSLYMAQIGSYN